MSCLHLPAVTAQELGELLLDLRKKLGGTDVALAKALGISPTHVNRITSDPSSIGVETCLRLANVTAANPSAILRVTRKGEVADLLDRLYGAAAKRRAPELKLVEKSAEEKDLDQWWGDISIETRAHIRSTFESFQIQAARRRRRKRTA